MKSSRPKVLHEAAGRPMLEWVLDAARAAGCERLLVVVGHGAEQVRATVGGDDVTWVTQREQRGTGHALAQVKPHLEGESKLLVLSGDVPLLTAASLERLVRAAERGWGSMAVAELARPGSLGRVFAGPQGNLECIIEAADATDQQLANRRINAGIYVLPAPEVFAYLEALEPDNAKGELYLTAALGAAAADARRIELVELEDPAEAFGVNRRSELARVHRELLLRTAERMMEGGVGILDAATTVIEAGVQVGEDTVLHPGVTLLHGTRIGVGCILHQGAWLKNSTVGDGAVILPYSVIDGAQIAENCQVGPFARLRPGAVLERGARVGNFVEVKNSRLREGVKAGHLAYLGDADVGAGANIGAGVVTCNYDGVSKHATRIGSGAFVGSDTMLVAPVNIGEGAMTAAGSVVTKDVPAGALAVERSSQKNILGWAKRWLRRRRS